MHTSPLAQPGHGDAGGMNVYIGQLSRALARTGVRVEAFTLLTAPPEDADPSLPAARSTGVSPGYTVHELYLPEAAGAGKEAMAELTGAFGRACAERVRGGLPAPDVIHAHYWLSGRAAESYREALGEPVDDVGSSRTGSAGPRGIPLVAVLHTSAMVKNLSAGPAEPPEPASRVRGEREVIRSAAALIVNTEAEAAQMASLYGADPARTRVIPPGVDAAVFRPGPPRPADGRFRVLFAGRPQPLKGPEILLRAVALARPAVPGIELEIRGTAGERYLAELAALARELGIDDVVRFYPATTSADLAEAFRRADVVACPSSSETFGLVALEAQACGAVVLGSDVTGLRAALDDGRAGLLVPRREPDAWARALGEAAAAPALRKRLSAAAVAHAHGLTWDDAARRTVRVYEDLLNG
ncbi:glycosyltransferase [Rothia halotolerans]|uniref:glycosyltransferase n=1 Tax=Rothia halotolerans TaxID=405770 RepID=UPI00101DA851|nr:glycosyltransferase [Rothia halotolerans]